MMTHHNPLEADKNHLAGLHENKRDLPQKKLKCFPIRNNRFL